jgi:hypothetical protein
MKFRRVALKARQKKRAEQCPKREEALENERLELLGQPETL